MATKKKYDGKYVSLEKHEIDYISKLFLNEHGEPLHAGWLYYTHLLITANRKKVLRTEFYKIIELMGYRKDPQLKEK